MHRSIVRLAAVVSLVALGLATAPVAAQQNLVPGQTDQLGTFTWVIDPGNTPRLQTSNFPTGWGGNFWSPEGSGSLTLEKVPGTGVVAFGIANRTAPAAGQLYTDATLAQGHYRISFSYLTKGRGQGRFELRPKQVGALTVARSSVPAQAGPNGTEFKLPAAADWADFDASVEATADTVASLMFQNGAVGEADGFYFRNLTVEPVNADGSAVSAEQSVPQQPDAYHSALRQELAENHGLPSGFAIFGATEDDVLKRFHLHGPAADAAAMSVVPVEGQPFGKALRIEQRRTTGEFWHTMVQALSPVPVRKGDVLLLTCYARGGVTNLAGSPALTSVSLKPMPSEPFGWASRELVLDDRWQRVLLPFVATEDREAGQVEGISPVATKVQWVELGGISVINYGSAVGVGKLPDSAAIKADYAGRATDAPWRREAEERIRRHRTADLKVEVVDAAGQPVPDADVTVAMTRSAFRWGTSSIPGMAFPEPIAEWARAGAEVDKKYLFDLFNSTTIDIVLKHEWWAKATEAEKVRQLEGIKYVHDRGLRVRGHTMVWPSFTNMPTLRPLAGDPKGMQQAILTHIRDVGSRTKAWCDEWDVLNEPYGNQEITRIVGDMPAVAEWFRVARETVPGAKLYINEGFTPGQGTATEAYYYDFCKQLLATGAPLDGIGVQCHIGVGPPDIDKLWASLERFAALKPGIDLAVTEFDMNARGDTKLEGDYTRDLLTIIYSHPNMTGFTMWGYYGSMHWLQYAPLFDDAGNVRESGKPWFDLVLGQWKTKATGTTDDTGHYTTRGHLGDYAVAVTAGGKTTATKLSLTRDGGAVRVTLE